MTKFEWDENKRRKTLRDRGLDFIRARVLFDGRSLLESLAQTGAEDRVQSIGEINGEIYSIVWTWRGEARRFISFRRARPKEERAYRELYGG